MSQLAEVIEFKTQTGEIIEQFLQDKLKKSEHTFIAYHTDIVQLFKSVFDKEISMVSKADLDKLDLTKLKAYFDDLYNKAKNNEIKCTNNTINRKQSSIKELIRYLKARNVITTDISYLELLENLPEDTESIEYMPVDVAKQYAEYFLRFEKHKPLEKHLLVRLALDTGLRLGELLSLRWNQFTEDVEFVKIQGRGKGNKKWIDKIKYNTYNELLRIKSNDTDKVFSLSRKNVHDMMTRAKRDLRHEDRNYSFHSFKKTAVTFAYRLTGSIREAQRKGRHSDLKTVQIYLEEDEAPITGIYSIGENTNHNLYKTIDHDKLVEALEQMPKDFLFILNCKLDSNRE